jgi:hypothetical protein
MTTKGIRLLEKINKNILTGKTIVKVVIFEDDYNVETLEQARDEIKQGNYYIEYQGKLKKEFYELEKQLGTLYLHDIGFTI